MTAAGLNLEVAREIATTAVAVDDDDLITPTALAAELHLAPATLSDWRVRGIGPPFVKLSKLVAYRRGAVRAWLATRERKSTSDQGEQIAA